MEQNEVPQDNIRTYANNKKAMYATDSAGNYDVIASSGWKIEEEATMQAVQELERLAKDAYTKVGSGSKSPLFFYMYDRRMDLQVLSESTGIYKWRIKRHFNPSVFWKLSSKMLDRYGNALGMTAEELCRMPEQK
ncbi:hypothetical protein UWK_01565 [Desulfocapsa sulfexigens DSM 10523]|uniref:Uncharacterized protein n=1 Tax=Desulfocapsa sulfexigens (strain DSM 10523 / SB164P1) TaxID=1167006 RepID=M1P3S0_DESSD|nr:hypothetical protein [Desulfocapsa sulfexigens]AGF78123.1 hypothetical protein UWK_01565 [Desulfocapsa sulfexigens DSM 10523]